MFLKSSLQIGTISRIEFSIFLGEKYVYVKHTEVDLKGFNRVVTIFASLQ
jgi:hypothetical protein